jgi:hypothetical protein
MGAAVVTVMFSAICGSKQSTFLACSFNSVIAVTFHAEYVQGKLRHCMSGIK